MREVAKTGVGSYARGNWGFMGQYRGSEMTLRIVGTGSRLAPGPNFDAGMVREALSPVLTLARQDTLSEEDLEQYPDLCLCRTAYCTDGAWLARLFAATDPTGETSSIRRQTMQMLTTAVEESPIRTVDGDLTAFVAYSPALLSHDRLADSAICRQWRGVVFRYESVNAWRSLWEALVDRIGQHATVTRQELRDWLADHVPAGTVADFQRNLPDTLDNLGQPAPAERTEEVLSAPQPLRCISILALGARRHGELTGQELLGFQGPAQNDVFEELAPMWMAHRLHSWADRPMRDFAADLVDVLINRSQRIALLKTRFDRRTGRVTIPTRVQVRDDLVYRLHTETALTASLRWWQLLRMGEQTGLFRRDPSLGTGAGEAATWRLGPRGDLLV
ncbi:hypothetical protein LY71_1162 [Geodermatophilus tzadiensis]|uniref:Uncharacterized protein n=2 Tax=Geodermatophilus tzadiensis TaxID=1137988 RepID=A0A2T0TFA4_9ACTN|nr:hypothetical protein LY71_1162 [Geodermatophilus tzadiensis]